MKNPEELFKAMFADWIKRRGSTEADEPLLRAVAWEFFAFGHDTAVLNHFEKAQTAAREIPTAILDENRRFLNGL